MAQAWFVRAHEKLESGKDAPLLTGDARRGPPDKREISLRWMAGILLTGVTAIGLMGGALFVALDGRHILALPAGVMDARGGLGISAETTQRIEKSNRLQFREEEKRSKDIVRVSMVTRDGSRDLIRVRPYVRVQASMSVRRDPTTAEIPKFNPIKLYTDSQDNGQDNGVEVVSDAIYTATVDGEVAMSAQPYPTGSLDLNDDISLTTAEVETIVRDAAHFLVDGSIQVEAMAYVSPDQFVVGEDKPWKRAARVIPENKTAMSRNLLPTIFEREIEVTVGDTLFQVLDEQGLPLLDVERIGAILQSEFRVASIDPGDMFAMEFDQRIDNRGVQPLMRLTMLRDDEHLATIARTDRGELVKAPPRTRLEREPAQESPTLTAAAGISGSTLTTYQSIYQTAYSQDLADSIIPDLIRIFSHDVDFNRTASSGDELRVFYGLSDALDPWSTDEILYAGLTIDGETHNYYRFRTPDDGAVDYYDEEGRSAKKFLMRKPIVGGLFQSGYGMRRHPILGYRRMHRGVDWSAPQGTPILAAGDGVVLSAKWASGSGRQIKIRHANGYKTSYSHQTAFAKGIAAGARVRQGQVIGYVGSTGLSTGPHLHYEVHVNGRTVDPMRIRLPRGRTLEGEILEAFLRERSRVDDLLTHEGIDPTQLAAIN